MCSGAIWKNACDIGVDGESRQQIVNIPITVVFYRKKCRSKKLERTVLGYGMVPDVFPLSIMGFHYFYNEKDKRA